MPLLTMRLQQCVLFARKVQIYMQYVDLLSPREVRIYMHRGHSSKAKRDCGVNPCLWSSNWSRPHLSTYIVISEGQEGVVLLCESQ